MTRIFLLNLGLLYVNVGFWSRLQPGWQPLSVLGFAACAVPSLMLVDGHGSLRLLSAAVQVAFHLTVASTHGAPFCHALLATTALLSVRHVSLASDGTPVAEASRGPALDAGTAVAAALTITACVAIVAQLVGASTQFSTSVEVLRDAARISDVYLMRRMEP